MLSDYDIALQVQALYDTPEASFDKIFDVSGVFYGIKLYEDCSLIVFRGSTTFEDWFRDFQGMMVYDRQLGGVEAGFVDGMREVPRDFLGKVYVAGHSLGAARALLYSGLAMTNGNFIPEVVTFGSPRPGGPPLREILSPVTIRSYRNGHDPVCDFPLDIPIIDPYCHPRELISVDVPPPVNDPWGLVARHHMELYVQAMKERRNG